MTERGSGKVTGIWQIVRLKEFLQKWQSITLTSGSKGPPPESSSHGDEEEERERRRSTNSTPKESSSHGDEEEEGERRRSTNSTPTESRSHGGIFPAINKRLMNSYVSCDSDDEESCQSTEPPPDVPKGYLAVYVGPELHRFVIPTSYLTHSLFKVLLEKAEEEFGYDHNGALTFPCEIETFNYLLKCIDSNYDHLHDRAQNDPSLEE